MNTLSIGRKINWTLAITFGLVVILAGEGIWASLNAQASLTSVVDAHAAAQATALEISQLATSALSQQRAIILRVVQSDQAAMREYEQHYRADRAALAQKLEALLALPDRHRERETVAEELAGLSRAWDAAHARFWALALKGQSAEMTEMCRSEVTPLAKKVSVQIERLVRAESAALTQSRQMARESLERQAWVSGSVALVSLLVLLAGIWGVRNGMNSLGAALADLRRMSDEVMQASGSLSNTSQALADGATRSAASTEETASSSTEVRSMAQRNSDSAKQAAIIVSHAQEKVEDANRSLAKLEETMAGIGTSAGKIARIIKVIDDIAFQTNILSLNAAVEAARAGDAGMGFAVVADEVRGLAQRCAKAAQETSELINESITRAAEGKAAAGEVAQTIRSVTEETDSIRALVTEVSQGSEGQARAMDEVASAVAQIERVTQDSAANAEEAAAASEELTAQAAELRHIMERITELAGVGADAGSAPAHATPAPTPSRSLAPPAQSPRPSSSSRPGAVLKIAADDDDFRPF